MLVRRKLGLERCTGFLMKARNERANAVRDGWSKDGSIKSAAVGAVLWLG